ncbi:serine/threonine-protein kinase [Carex littledalei]|uniref:Serine/threonine-protein kinase n=1 Tax=Carex littledalei TaxID=544730 RepID=A0A833VGH1_9POAL|nr:serine/threonine-protein kinase [Carex littledalei]
MKFLNLLIVLFLFYNFFGGSRSSSCGDLRDISYPYHLPGTCKLKAYELQCDGNDTVLYIGATKYLVKDVSIKNKTLRVLDPELAIGGCHLPSKSFSWGSNILTWYSSYDRSNFIYFFNCTDGVEDSMYKLIDCMDGPRSRVYALNTYNIEVQSTPKSCRYVGSTAANSEVQMRWNNTDGVEIMQMLRRRFVVSWDQGSIAESCPRLQDCWTLSKIKFMHKTVDFSNASTTGTITVNYSTTGYQLFEFLYVQPSFLECIYNTQGSEIFKTGIGKENSSKEMRRKAISTGDGWFKAEQRAGLGVANRPDGRDVVTVDSSVLLAIWSGLDEGPEKDKLYHTLKSSPLFGEFLKSQATGGTPAAGPVLEQNLFLQSNEEQMERTGGASTGGKTNPKSASTVPRTCFLPTLTIGDHSRTSVQIEVMDCRGVQIQTLNSNHAPAGTSPLHFQVGPNKKLENGPTTPNQNSATNINSLKDPLPIVVHQAAFNAHSPNTPTTPTPGHKDNSIHILSPAPTHISNSNPIHSPNSDPIHTSNSYPIHSPPKQTRVPPNPLPTLSPDLKSSHSSPNNSLLEPRPCDEQWQNNSVAQSDYMEEGETKSPSEPEPQQQPRQNLCHADNTFEEEPSEEIEPTEEIERSEEFEPTEEIEPSEDLTHEIDGDLDISDYLGSDPDPGSDPRLNYHPDPIFSDNSDSYDHDPLDRPTDEIDAVLQAELDAIQEDIRLQDEKEAYLSALADPAQAPMEIDSPAIPTSDSVIPTPDSVQLEIPHIPELIPTPQNRTMTPELGQQSRQQSNLRRSARILEKGVTKRYTEERTKARKCDKNEITEEDLNPARQAELFQALREEFLAVRPLQEATISLASTYCGMNRPLDPHTTLPTTHIASNSDATNAIHSLSPLQNTEPTGIEANTHPAGFDETAGIEAGTEPAGFDETAGIEEIGEWEEGTYEERTAQRRRVAITEKWEMLKPLYNLHLKLEE